MLDWLSGRSEDSSHEESPETPAHLFAVKAFKSAIFGTPAPDQTRLADDNDGNDKPLDNAPAVKVKPLKETTIAALSNLVPSPAKGILLTPGTIGARRKTVSWGACKEQTDSDPKEKRRSLDGTKPVPESQPTAQISIRRSLFNKSKDTDGSQAGISKSSTRPDTKTLPPQNSADAGDEDSDDADVTVDLQKPRSVSGKHWMEVYHRDHNISKLEMKKLIRYSQVAKDHAARRDREVVRLKDKLSQSEERVQELEERVRELEKTPTATQTTAPTMSLGKVSGSQDAQVAQLEKVAKSATEKADKLQRENDNFKKTILRVKEEMAKYEERHKTWVEQRKKKDERHAESRKALRDKILLQKTHYAEQLRQVEEEAEHDKAALRREIAFLRGEVISMSPARYPQPTAGRGIGEPQKIKDSFKQNSKLHDILREEAANPAASSPTILENHLSKALGESYSSPKVLLPKPKPSAKTKPDSDSTSNLPAMLSRETRRTTGNDNPLVATKVQRPAVRPRKAVRVKARQAAGARSPNALPPDREAAARLRIAQRSAEKQRDTRFLFNKGKENLRPLDKLVDV